MSKEMSPEETLKLVQDEVIGRIGCYENGRIYVVPITYVYSDGSVYGFSGEGLKMRMMRANPAVCLEVERVRTLGSWESVIADGRFEELSGEGAKRGTRLIVDRLLPMCEDEMSRNRLHAAANGEATPIVYRIVLGQMTGRAE